MGAFVFVHCLDQFASSQSFTLPSALFLTALVSYFSSLKSILNGSSIKNGGTLIITCQIDHLLPSSLSRKSANISPECGILNSLLGATVIWQDEKSAQVIVTNMIKQDNV